MAMHFPNWTLHPPDAGHTLPISAGIDGRAVHALALPPGPGTYLSPAVEVVGGPRLAMGGIYLHARHPTGTPYPGHRPALPVSGVAGLSLPAALAPLLPVRTAAHGLMRRGTFTTAG